MKKYPDVTEIIKKREEHRRALSELSFEEKIEMVFKIRGRSKFIKSGRVVKNSKKRGMKTK